MEISFSLDWLRGTFPYTPNFSPEQFSIERKPVFEEVRGIGSYTNTVRSELYSVSWHNQRPEMRIMVQMTGQQLSLARQMGYTDQKLVNWMVDLGARFTRIDFAVDIIDSGGAVLDFREAWKTPALVTSAKKITVIESEGTSENMGNTVYLGSRQSTRMVRIYDKGKERHTNLDWLRVELEWKQERADQLASDMRQHGVQPAGISHLRAFIPGSLIDWFEDAIAGKGEIFEVDKLGRPETDHERWLRTVCIPALAEAVENGVTGIVEALEAILEADAGRSKHGPNLLPRPK